MSDETPKTARTRIGKVTYKRGHLNVHHFPQPEPSPEPIYPKTLIGQNAYEYIDHLNDMMKNTDLGDRITAIGIVIELTSIQDGKPTWSTLSLCEDMVRWPGVIELLRQQGYQPQYLGELYDETP